MRLSILICSLPNRLKKFNVIQDITKQANEYNDVEVLYLGDNKIMSTGDKRNALINMSSGDYISFVDDDDKVSKDYVKLIREATKEGKHAISFNGYYFCNDALVGAVDYSVSNKKDHNKKVKNNRMIFYRIPNHICAISKALVKSVMFKSISIGEDSDFAKRIKPLIKTETKIEEYIYYYYDVPKKDH